ncbi:MAG: hypothetical protein QW078_00035 [Thermoplasmatales archaeon]
MKTFVIIFVIFLVATVVPMNNYQGYNNQMQPQSPNSNATAISAIVQRAFDIIAGVSGLIIAILWIPIAIGYFSKDLDRKSDAKERTKDALIGTVIFVMAVSGVLYAVIHYVVAG